jgi:DNA invertase Pin-like site-specific DNA recombinase
VARYAAAHGMEIVAEFYDAGVSGTEPIESRPGFAAMLDRIESNGVRIILVEDASRFARDLLVQEAGLAMLAHRGVRVLTSTGEDMTATDDPMRKMLRQIVGAVVEAEKARLVAKLRGARDRKATATGGYRIEGNSYATQRPELLSALRGLRQADPEATMQQLADQLAERGFLTASGKPLARQAVHRTLAQMNLT